MSPRIPDVIIVQKQTALERYTKRPLNVDFYDYLERDGQSHEALVFAHDAHVSTRATLVERLDSLGLSHDFYNLDELPRAGFSYGHGAPDSPPGQNSVPLAPKSGVVISLGGDGTLLHASHYVSGSTLLLGINSCPPHSVGHLCAGTQAELPALLEQALAGTLPTTSVRRLKVTTSRQHPLPLGLNDVLVCNRHPAATSRYQLTILRPNGNELSEKQLSSGIWISAAAGSTAAIGSHGLPRLPISATSFLYSVREPYRPHAAELLLRAGVLDGEGTVLRLFSRMRQCLVCVDGPDSFAFLGFGESLEISLPPECALRLATPPTALLFT